MTSPGTGAVPLELLDPVTGREVRRLTGPPNDNMHAYYDISPWSPNGRRIVYASHAHRAIGADVWVMDADGDNPRHIAAQSTFDPHTACNQKWADDHTVALPAADGRDGVRMVDVDTLDERFVALPGGVRKLSPDGQLGIAIDSSAEAGLVEIQTGTYTRICTLDDARRMSPHQEILASQPSVLLNPRWSHGGRHAMICHRTLNQPQHLMTEQGPVTVEGPELVEIFLYSVDDGSFRFLTRINHHPTWHPDDASILFVGRDPQSGRHDLRMIDIDGSPAKVVFDAEHVPAGHPLFHPADDQLLVTDAFGGRYGYGIILIDLRSQRQELLVSMPLGEDPATAPEARASDPPNWHCWSYPRWRYPNRGSRARFHAHPCWNRDGTQMLYLDVTGGTPQIHVLDTSDIAAGGGNLTTAQGPG